MAGASPTCSIPTSTPTTSSRSRALAEQTGATLHLPQQDRVSFSFAPIGDGDTLAIGSARLVALRTPGHTLESTCYLLDEQALFTGDTLFLAGVGRPDLEAEPEQARGRAPHALYASLQRCWHCQPRRSSCPAIRARRSRSIGSRSRATLAEVYAQTALLQAGRG